MLDGIRRVYKGVNVAFEWTAYALLVLMTVITMYRVIMRFFFNFTPSWTEEMSCILMIWLAMIGFALGVREWMHLSITLFYDLLPRSIQRVLNGLRLFLQGFTGLYMVLAGLRLSIDQFHTTMSAVKIFPFADRMMPNSILYVIVPISGLLIIVYTAIQIFDKNDFFRLKTLDTKKIDTLKSQEGTWE
jgi:TRAP-type C4-dicarboxylate transport system permease small subunit